MLFMNNGVAAKSFPQHSFIFNDTNRKSEQIVLKTDIFNDGNVQNPKFVLKQTLIMNSYDNMTMMCMDCMTPSKLRELADELETAMIKSLDK